MDKFTSLINKISKSKIQGESKTCKKTIISPTLNEILGEEYPTYSGIQSSKALLMKIWKDIIANAARGREGGISRTWIRLFEAVDKVIKALFQNENTMENVCTEFRKVIRQKYGDNDQIYIKSTHILGVSRERAIERRENYQNKVAEKGLNRRNLTPIYDDEIYAAIDAGINSSDPLEKTIAVMLNTGSRSIEVMKVSTYSEVKDNSSFINIKGIAKDRSKKGYENKVILRPLINLNADEVINAVEYIRKHLDLEGTNDEISQRYNQTLNKRMKKLFANHPELTAHKCRYIAGQMAFLLYGKGGTENTYLQQYLGHEDSSTTRTYQSINVKLRHEVEIPDDIKLKISKLIHDDEKNIQDHKEIQSAINEIKAKKIKIKQSNVPYPEYINPKTHLGDAQKIQNLTLLMKTAKKDGIIYNQKQLKKLYGYGSNILSLFWQLIKTGKIVI